MAWPNQTERKRGAAQRVASDGSQQADRHHLGPGVEGLATGRPFFNEPKRDFSQNVQCERFDAAAAGAEVPGVAAAELLRRRRDELAGVIIREAGKTWREADADVCEAIDFCEYYARQAVELFRPQRAGRPAALRRVPPIGDGHEGRRA